MGNVELLNGVEMVWGSLWVGCICHTLKKSHFILSMLVHTKKESGPKPGSTYKISSEWVWRMGLGIHPIHYENSILLLHMDK